MLSDRERGLPGFAPLACAAGLKRLAISDFPGLRFEFLDVDRNVPAAGQAAIALQCRFEEADRFLPACHEATGFSVTLERAVLGAMGGGCHVAMGVHHRNDELLVYHEKHGRHTIDVTDLAIQESMEKVMATLPKT